MIYINPLCFLYVHADYFFPAHAQEEVDGSNTKEKEGELEMRAVLGKVLGVLVLDDAFKR